MGIPALFEQVHHVGEAFYGEALAVTRRKEREGCTPQAWSKHVHKTHAVAWEGIEHLVVDCEGLLFKYPGHGDADEDYYYNRATLCELMAKMVANKLQRLAAIPSDRLTLLFDDSRMTPQLKALEQQERDATAKKTQAAAKKRSSGGHAVLKRSDVLGSLTLADHVGMAGAMPMAGSASAMYMFFVRQRKVRSALKAMLIEAVFDWCRRCRKTSSNLELVVRTNDPLNSVFRLCSSMEAVLPRDQPEAIEVIPEHAAGEGELAAFQVVAACRGRFERQGVATLSDDTDVLAIGTQLVWSDRAAEELTVCVGTSANCAVLKVHDLARAHDLRSRVALALNLSLLGTDYVRRRQLRIAHNKGNDKVLKLYEPLKECVRVLKGDLVRINPKKLVAVLARHLLTPSSDALPTRAHWVYRTVFQVEYWGATPPAAIAEPSWLETLQKDAAVPEMASSLVVFVHPEHRGEPAPKKPKKPKSGSDSAGVPAVLPPCPNCHWQAGDVLDVDAHAPK